MNLKFMKIALEEAKKAYILGEVPIGAVIVKNDKVISKAYNKKEKNQLITEHAEIISIRKASKKLKNWRLNNCDIYITMEPCPMCASAIQQARISNVYYGCKTSDPNNTEIIEKIFSTINRNNRVKTHNNIMEEQCKKIIQDFFKQKR